jgi:putative hydrolase
VGIHCLCYHDAGIKKNTENLIACMKDHKVNIVSHPDDDHTPLDYPTLVAAAKQYQVALEVNNSSFYKPQSRINCVENYRTMLKLCEQTNTPIIIDSDAHDPSWVGNFTKAIALLNEVQFNPQLVLNTSVEKFKSFIAAK